MPKGVEHTLTAAESTRSPGVKKAVMPKGVEHPVGRSATRLGAGREEGRDAERR